MLRRCIVTCVTCSVLLTFPGNVSLLLGQGDPGELRNSLEELHERLNSYREKRSRTSQQIEAEQRQLNKFKQREHSVLSVLEGYKREIRARRRRIRTLRSQEERARRQLRELRVRLKKTRREVGDRRELLARRLRGIYKQGELMQGNILLEAGSLTDFVTRLRYFKAVIERDQTIIENFRNSQRELRNLKQKQADRHAYLERKRRQVEEALEELRAVRRQKKKDLKKIRSNRAFQQKRIRELENQQQKLSTVVNRLRKKRRSAKARLERLSHEFGRSKGELPWPVDSRAILRPFGTWRENGIVHTNDGIDIGVEEGESVKAVAPGRVLYAKRYRGMGRVVILRHKGQYLSLYGSLVEVAVKEGDSLREGQVLGRAGQTSGMDQPRLYFQLFQAKQVLNPRKWLR